MTKGLYYRTYSLILGRPTIAGEGTYDVKLVPGAVHGDGSPNPYMHYQHAFIGLMHLVEETVTKVSSICAQMPASGSRAPQSVSGS